MLRQLNSYLPIKQIVLPLPETDTEISYASSIMALADEFEIGVGFFEPGKQFEVSGAAISITSSRKAPYSHPSLAISFSLECREHLIVDGNPDVNGDTDLETLARRADIVYLCSHSSTSSPPRSLFGKDTIVFTPTIVK